MVYLLMAAFGLIGVVLVARQERRPAEVAATFVCAAAGILLADWIAYGWFGLYAYLPHMVTHPQIDHAIGYLLADLLFVPSLATLVVDRLPGLGGAVLGAFTVTATEFLFMRHGLLRHHGWETWYSALLFPPFFWLVGNVRQRLARVELLDGSFKAVVRICLLFVAIGLFTVLLRPFDVTRTSLHWLRTARQNQSLGRFLTYPTVFVPLAYWVSVGGRRRRWWRWLVATLALAGASLLFLATGWRTFRAPYTWYYDVAGQAATLWVACLLDGLLTRRRSWEKARTA